MPSLYVRRLLFLVLLISWPLWQTPLAAQDQHAVPNCYTYRVIDLPEHYPGFSDINNAGTILGINYTLVRQGRTKLRVKNIVSPDPRLRLRAYAINKQRDIAGGASDIVTGEQVSFVLRNLRVPRIERIQFPGGHSTTVYGMNSKRDLVGAFARFNEESSHGFWRPKGKYIQIDAPFPGVVVTKLADINVHQEIVGWYKDANGIHGLHIIDGIHATLDVPGTLDTYLESINDHGVIVGIYTINIDEDTVAQPFVYQDGEFTTLTPDIGTNDSVATGVNNAGEIVGHFETNSGHGPHLGFIATPAACANTVAQR